MHNKIFPLNFSKYFPRHQTDGGFRHTDVWSLVSDTRCSGAVSSRLSSPLLPSIAPCCPSTGGGQVFTALIGSGMSAPATVAKFSSPVRDALRPRAAMIGGGGDCPAQRHQRTWEAARAALMRPRDLCPSELDCFSSAVCDLRCKILTEVYKY